MPRTRNQLRGAARALCAPARRSGVTPPRIRPHSLPEEPMAERVVWRRWPPAPHSTPMAQPPRAHGASLDGLASRTVRSPIQRTSRGCSAASVKTARSQRRHGTNAAACSRTRLHRRVDADRNRAASRRHPAWRTPRSLHVRSLRSTSFSSPPNSVTQPATNSQSISTMTAPRLPYSAS